MRKNRLFILGIFTVMVALVSLSLVSGTWAKYISTVSGEDTARVAKWAWAYKDSDLASSTSEVDFKLFETIYDTEDGAAEGDVQNVYSTGGVTQLIAPGTQGSFKISFTNKSEVTANLDVAFEQNETSTDIPIQFSFDAGFASGVVDDIADLSWHEELAVGSATVEKTVYWRWAFNGTDSTDTTLGWKGTDTITVSMSVTFTQVD